MILTCYLQYILFKSLLLCFHPTHMKMSPLLAKGCKFRPLSSEGSLACYICFNRGCPFIWKSSGTRDIHTCCRGFGSGDAIKMSLFVSTCNTEERLYSCVCILIGFVTKVCSLQIHSSSNVSPLWPFDLELYQTPTLRFLLLRLKPDRSSLREYMMLHPASYGFSMNVLGMTGAKRHEMVLVSLTGGLVQGFSD